MDPKRRPSALEAQNHPWIQRARKKAHDYQDTLNPKVVDGLVQFKSLSTTKRFLCGLLSFTLQPEQITGLHQEFEKMDVDGTGEISLSKFKDALLDQSGGHSLSEDEIEKIFNGLKVRDTDMSIQWHEFLATCLSQCSIDDRNIRLAFERLDTERKGFITWKDLQRSMDVYGSANSKHDLQHIWVNHIIDYKINKEHMSYDDFYSLLKLEKISTRPSLRIDGFDNFNPVDELNQHSFRHSMIEPSVDATKIFSKDCTVTPVKAYQDIRVFIAEASKGVGGDQSARKGRTRRATVITGNHCLLMSRQSIMHSNTC